MRTRDGGSDYDSHEKFEQAQLRWECMRVDDSLTLRAHKSFKPKCKHQDKHKKNKLFSFFLCLFHNCHVEQQELSSTACAYMYVAFGMCFLVEHMEGSKHVINYGHV